ncbi:MAG TPA: sigma-70 family RNA polymerase sigma factor [Anaerolineae bacterium]|nr:sigma-70 family RNA polymerase sigma factor [Anaerolineae bacterium]
MNELIERWQAGDERAAEAIYNQHRALAFRLAYGLLGDAAEAEEAAQDALAYALAHIQRYDPLRAGFSTWLHTITVSRCRDRQRRRQSPVAWVRPEADLVDPAPTPEHHASRQEARSEVWQAVQALNPRLREAILLRYWAGHTYHEMADILGCPVPTAQSRVRLAFERLRAALTPADLIALEEGEVS